jgi:lipopolysaccharide/colanic/teichoic acid biosynthesis glycosyltransferase
MAGKRLFDVLASAVLLVIAAPLLLFVAVLVKATSPGDALFGHERIGRGGFTFRCLKFRTMHSDAEARLEVLLQDPALRREFEENHKLRCDPRVTRIGGFLRSTSIDELPQLLNVLRGDMSLVGPRPIVDDELGRYGAAAAHYLAVRPGITGSWQVRGRSDTTFDERVALDREYVDEMGVWADAKILVATVGVVVARIGAY